MNLAVLDRRSTDTIERPRSGVVEDWMDVEASAFEARRDIGHAYAATTRQRDPLPRLYAADRRLIRLEQFARQRAGEAEGISYIAPNQTSLWDGCVDGVDGERGA